MNDLFYKLEKFFVGIQKPSCLQPEMMAANANEMKKLENHDVIKLFEILFETTEFQMQQKAEVLVKVFKYLIANKIRIIGTGLAEIYYNEGYGFVRFEQYGYANSFDDFYIGHRLIRRFNIRGGDIVMFVVSYDSTTSSESKKSKIAIDDVITINNTHVSKMKSLQRRSFEKMTPVYPDRKLKLVMHHKDEKSDCGTESTRTNLATLRIIDVFTPIGYGQRALVIAPPKAGKTYILQNIAMAISALNSDVDIFILTIGERPEEITDMKSKLGDKCQIFSSDFNDNSNRQTSIAELCIERAKRLVEMGKNVVVFLDSLTRLARAYNSSNATSGKVMSGGIEFSALQQTKKIFGSARNLQEGGSLTIVATCLVDTGSRMDEVIYEEFKGTSNMDISLSRYLAERNMFPAIDILKSGTRNSANILEKGVFSRANEIRRMLTKSKGVDSVEIIILAAQSSNTMDDFLGMRDL